MVQPGGQRHRRRHHRSGGLPAVPSGGPTEAPVRLTVPPEAQGERFDSWLTRQLGDVSRSHTQSLIQAGSATVDGSQVRASAKMLAGQIVEVRVPAPIPTTIKPQPIPLTIVYEDGDLLVIDKPAGLVVHPAPGHADGTLVNALMARWGSFKGLKGSLRPGIVHRLDKDTSGLLMVAKNDASMLKLAAQIKERRVQKEYLALVEGRLEPARGRIEAPLGRHHTQRQHMAVTRGGREATTHYEVEAYAGEFTLVRVKPVTGRTHQIRVHLAFTHHPVAGDTLYGKPAAGLPRHFLHAARLGFRQPTSGEWIEIESPLPPDLAAFAVSLGLPTATAASTPLP